ncbi:MAG: hypothetical protein AAFY28_16255 [Actinomycetota bacterium]
MTERSHAGRHRGGIVATFDEIVGLGTVVDDTGASYPFHCIEIVDGTRSIAVGTRVEFSTRPRIGRHEAVAIRG